MHESVMPASAASAKRRSRRRVALILPMAVLLVAAGCGSDDDDAATNTGTPDERTAELATQIGGGKAITEDDLPAGFEASPVTTVDGQEMKFDAIPGHYWKVLGNNVAVGLHFQSEEPFQWAKDVGDNELLYIVYAIPGSCEGLNYQAGLASEDSTPFGKPLPGFDHWHGLVGDQGAGERGHWLMHIPVRDFTFAGMEGNPFEGKEVTGGDPGFIPVCEPAMADNPAMGGPMPDDQ